MPSNPLIVTCAGACAAPQPRKWHALVEPRPLCLEQLELHADGLVVKILTVDDDVVGKREPRRNLSARQTSETPVFCVSSVGTDAGARAPGTERRHENAKSNGKMCGGAHLLGSLRLRGRLTRDSCSEGARGGTLTVPWAAASVGFAAAAAAAPTTGRGRANGVVSYLPQLPRRALPLSAVGSRAGSRTQLRWGTSC